VSRERRRAAGPRIVDNTCGVVRQFREAILAGIRRGGVVPRDLVDVVTLTRVEVDGEVRWIVDFA